jgi:cysteinyl-tRNA synthetase
LSVVHDLTRHANAELELTQRGDEEAEKRLGALAAAFEELTGVLGIYPDVAGGKTPQAGITGPLVEIALEARDAARSGGRYEEADRIRSRLQDLGIAIEDTPSGTRWRHSS